MKNKTTEFLNWATSKYNCMMGQWMPVDGGPSLTSENLYNKWLESQSKACINCSNLVGFGIMNEKKEHAVSCRIGTPLCACTEEHLSKGWCRSYEVRSKETE